MSGRTMPRPRLPPDMVFTVQLLLECGTTDREIHRQTGVSRATVRSIRRSMEKYGQPYPPSSDGLSRSHVRLIQPEVEDVRRSPFQNQEAIEY